MNANFEQYAREQITGHEVRVDAEALWADIYPHVKPENGNRKILLFFILGVFVTLTGFGLFYYNNANNSDTIPTPSLDIATAMNSPVIINSSIEEVTTAATISESNLAIKNTTKEATTTQSNLNIKSTTVAQSAQAKISSNKGVKQTQVNKPANLNQLIVVEKEKDIISGSNIDATNATLTSKRKNYLSVEQLPTLFPKGLEFDRLENIDISAYKPKLKPMLAGNIFPPKEDKKKRKNTPDIFRDIKYGVGLYGGLSQSSSDLEAKSESAGPLVEARTIAESQLETLHLGLNAFIQTDKGLYLRSGVEYTRIGSLFSRNSEQVTMDTTIGIVEYQINAITGDTTFVEGDVIVTRTTRYNKKSYNYFHLVDVPVIFGFNFGENDDDWRIGVEAGVYANVLIKNKGEIPLADGSFYDIGDDPQKWYKTNIGISPYVGINLAYNYSQNLQFHATPSFRFNSVFSTDANPLTEKHGSLGVQAGVRYFFD